MRRVALALTIAALTSAPASAADPVLVAAGDVACAPADGDYNGGAGTVPPEATPGRCHQNHTADLIEALDPAHVLALGDLQYEDGALSKFNVSYNASWGRAGIKARTKPVPGNHEYGAGNTNNGNMHNDPNATGYFTYFQSQLAAEGPDAGNPQKGWYSFDVAVGNAKWHIVALNSECAAGLRVTVGWDGDCDVGSEQERWLRADLAADRSDCTLAYWHHPRFSSGGQPSTPIMAPIWNALYADYADVVLAGHAHNYERLGQAGPTGEREPGRGIRSWVVGTGGKDALFMQPQPLPVTDVRNNTAHGVLELTLHGPAPAHPRGWYEWQFVHDGQSGSTFTDSGSGDCVVPPPPAKPATAAVRDTLAPRVTRPRLSRKRFRVGLAATPRVAAAPRGTVIGYTLSEAARTRFRIERRLIVRRGGRRVKRYRRAGTLRRTAKAGRRRVRFSGRIGRKRLRPGIYRLTITVRDTAGNAGRPRRLLFRIVK